MLAVEVHGSETALKVYELGAQFLSKCEQMVEKDS